jgi:hypothetical protein
MRAGRDVGVIVHRELQLLLQVRSIQVHETRV